MRATDLVRPIAQQFATSAHIVTIDFGLSNGYWLRVQAAYDTELAESALADQLKNIRPWSETSAQSGHRR